MRLRHLVLVGLIGCSAALSARAAVAAPSAEDEVKAEIALNLLRFVKWPQEALPAGQPLVLCAVQSSRIARRLAGYGGTSINGGSLAVKVLNRHMDGLGECQAIFVEAGDPYGVLRLSAATHGKPVLLIAEGERGLEQGAGMAVSLAGSRVVIDVDLTALNAAGLTVSSKLLRLARTVIK